MVCEVCGMASLPHELNADWILCDLCDPETYFHMKCVGLPTSFKFKKEDWFCDSCCRKTPPKSKKVQDKKTKILKIIRKTISEESEEVLQRVDNDCESVAKKFKEEILKKYH